MDEEPNTQTTDEIPGQGQRIEEWAELGHNTPMQGDEDPDEAAKHDIRQYSMEDENIRLTRMMNDVIDVRLDELRSELTTES